jgi:hypothetical protein
MSHTFIGVKYVRADLALVLASDDADRAGIITKRHDGNVGIDDGLVAGRRHLVPGGKVHPELNHFQARRCE